MQILASAPTKEGIEKQINKYFYSTTYKIEQSEKANYFNVVSIKGLSKDVIVKLENKRYKFYGL